MRLRSEAVAVGIGLSLLGAVPVLAADQAMPAGAPAKWEMTVDGSTLFTPDGKALYFSAAAGMRGGGGPGAGPPTRCSDKVFLTANDQQSGLGEREMMGAKHIKSCIDKWPPYLADANATPVGEFTIVDGLKGKQWAWQGRALHLSVKDKNPGERNGAGGGGGFGGGRGGGGLRLATQTVDFPMGMRLGARDEGLVLTSATGKALYTPKKGTKPDSLFKPVVAAGLATVTGDLSIVDGGPGIRQYAFRGKPLYAMPETMSEAEVEDAGGWELVVYHPSAGRPANIGRQITLNGEVYTNHEGLSLYTYSCNTSGGAGVPTPSVSCDDPGDPAAYWVALCGSAQECARRWKPYLAREGDKPVGDWTIVDVAYPMFTDPLGTIYPPEAPRVKAWAHRGRPVYTYYEDKKPGDLWGDRTSGLWGGGSFSLMRVPGRGLIE